MRKKLKRAFIPHKDNDYKPHLFEEVGIAVLTLFIIAVFLLSATQGILVRTSRFLAAVLPAVLVDLTNEERQENANLTALTVNPILEEAARLKAEDMASKGYFAHTSPEGLTPWHWFGAAGYQFINAGENLAVNFSDSKDVVEAWMDSPGHRANIMNRSFTEIGIATSEGYYKGQKVTFVVQMFGTPQYPSSLVQKPEPEVLGTEEAVPAVVEVPVPMEVATEVPQDGFESTFIAYDSEPLVETTPREEVVTSERAIVSEENTEPTVEEIPSYATPLEEAATSPGTMLQFAYMTLGFIILISLILIALVEFRRHHWKNVGYAVFVLFLMALMWYMHATLLATDVLVALN